MRCCRRIPFSIRVLGVAAAEVFVKLLGQIPVAPLYGVVMEKSCRVWLHRGSTYGICHWTNIQLLAALTNGDVLHRPVHQRVRLESGHVRIASAIEDVELLDDVASILGWKQTVVEAVWRLEIKQQEHQVMTRFENDV